MESRPAVARAVSIDIFRGLTMLVMIFVNDLAEVKGLPWWTYHFPSRQNGMTYVDVVFPAFLFVMGMAIPFAVSRRIAIGEPRLKMWFHILLRSVGLVVLGLILANAHKSDPRLTNIPTDWWPTIALIGAMLFWAVYPKDGNRTMQQILKWGGLVVLVAMFAIFRRTTNTGAVAWIDFRYWEILGLIGRVYLAACILYIPFRNIRWAPLAWLVLLTGTNMASRMGMTPLQRIFPYWIWPFDSGELPSIAMAGIVCWQIFFDERLAPDFGRKAKLAVAYAAALFIAGFLTLPLEVHKNAATPAWCLWSAGISVVFFLAIYWIAEVRRKTNWASFAYPAGANTLLTYLLPDLFYFTVGTMWSAWTPTSGWPGVIRSIVFTAAMLGLSGILTRRHVRLQL